MGKQLAKLGIGIWLGLAVPGLLTDARAALDPGEFSCADLLTVIFNQERVDVLLKPDSNENTTVSLRSCSGTVHFLNARDQDECIAVRACVGAAPGAGGGIPGALPPPP